MRSVHALALAVLASSLGGCLGVDNIGDLKHALGIEEPAGPPLLPPVAKAAVDLANPRVGEVVSFSASQSKDPQSLALSFAWTFGDGDTATGRDVTHAYRAAGAYAATVTVRNGAGLADVHSVRVLVAALDAAPVAAASAAPAAAWVGERVTFSSGGSYDPEGAVTRTLWDFGDGGGATSAEATHAYATPGRKVATLTVLDPQGNIAHARVSVAVSHAANATGVLDPLASRAEVLLPVPEAPDRIRAVLMYDPGNDLALEIRDASGKLVDFTPSGETRLPPSGRASLELVSPNGAWGDWTVTVVRHGGVRATWTLATLVVYGSA